MYIYWGCPADSLTNQAVLDQKVHGHTSRAPPVGIEPTSPPTKVVALPTKPQIPYTMIDSCGMSWHQIENCWGGTVHALEFTATHRHIKFWFTACSWMHLLILPFTMIGFDLPFY